MKELKDLKPIGSFNGKQVYYVWDKALYKLAKEKFKSDYIYFKGEIWSKAPWANKQFKLYKV